MKNLFIAIFVLFTFSSQAQSWAAKFESALFENRVNNYAAYTSEVKKIEGNFTKDEFQLISNRCLTKEGVFKLDISSDKSTIIVYYLESIDDWTIVWLFTEGVPALVNTLRVDQKVVHTF